MIKKYFLVLVLSTLYTTTILTKIYEFHIDLFTKDKIETEYTAYKLLKEDPLPDSINYLAIPWAVLINTKQLEKVPKIKINGGFTICQHIHYEKIIPLLKKIGIDVLFTPHVNKKYDGVTVLPFPHLAVNGIMPNSNKNLWYSFIGYNTHWTRKFIFDNYSSKNNNIIIERKQWHFNGKNQKEEQEEYQDVLARSRFSLCPRGTGASTLRFWESLQAGAIPVIIADDMQLPTNFDWNLCTLQIPEKNINQLEQFLSKISQERENAMRKQCLEAYALFSGNNFVKIVRNYYLSNH